jgi:hypothetical protein
MENDKKVQTKISPKNSQKEESVITLYMKSLKESIENGKIYY